MCASFSVGPEQPCGACGSARSSWGRGRSVAPCRAWPTSWCGWPATRRAYQAPPSRMNGQPIGGSWGAGLFAAAAPAPADEHPAVDPTVWAGSAGSVWPVAPTTVVSVVARPPTTVAVTGAGRLASGVQVTVAGWLGCGGGGGAAVVGVVSVLVGVSSGSAAGPLASVTAGSLAKDAVGSADVAATSPVAVTVAVVSGGAGAAAASVVGVVAAAGVYAAVVWPVDRLPPVSASRTTSHPPITA